jgi:broad specificity phosphatase PhoE
MSMSVIYLVRHGQASLFGRDYDVLSDVGVEQSRVVGAALASRGIEPDVIVRGTMRRHQQTTEEALAAAGWDGVEVEVDARWNEIDHVDIIKAHEPAYTSHAAMVDALVDGPEPDRAFRTVFDDALRLWVDGGGRYVETPAEFRARVDAALDDVVARTATGKTAVVFSSGGPVAAATATGLGLDMTAWLLVSRLVINASVTKLVAGESGVTVVSFNEHGHVEAAGGLTYH